MALNEYTFDGVLERLLLRSGKSVNSPTVADYPDVASMLNLRLQEVWDYPGGGWDFLRVIERVDFEDRLRLSGFGLAEVNDYYDLNAALVNDRVAYTLTGNITVEWSGTAWEVFDSADAVAYTSSEDVATPELVVTWAAVGTGVAPIGTVTISNYRKLDLSDGKQVLGVWDDDPREVPTAGVVRTQMLVADELMVREELDTVWYAYYLESPDWQMDSPVPTVYRMFVPAVVELTYADMLQQKSNSKETQALQIEASGYKRLDELCNKYAQMNLTGKVSVRSNARY